MISNEVRMLNSFLQPLRSFMSRAGQRSSNAKYLCPTKKMAFLLHEPMMLNHYESVWQALGKSQFSIVLTQYFYLDQNGQQKEGIPAFFKHVQARGYQVLDIEQVIDSGIRFDYSVSNHPISGGSKTRKPEQRHDRYKKLWNRILIALGRRARWHYGVDIDTLLPLQVGRKQIRYMYGADLSDAWSLMDWNEIYDIFLCHGVNDERIIKERFAGEVFVMGYPRYDEYFEADLDVASISKEFDLTPGKKTLLWMPTLGGESSSIPVYAHAIARLHDQVNIIVRPHPLSFVQEREYIAALEACDFKIDRTSTRNMNQLYGAADLVLADYGGTPFSAVFLGKNTVLLDVPGGDESPMNVGSSVLELKKSLPVYTPDTVEQLPEALSSPAFMQRNDAAIEHLFQQYFGSPRGRNAARVAKYLESL
ncbi:CDP-glycerol glycerophosphotransferase family protein [Pseudomonas baltica]|uniref:CDP-glycerol glycerophosphotransferase family protein n=1 Tax=Pseudomonas baltica TaxID=2762576 RepID=UPI0028A05086|nr:CDP-glycerol glycerophosphotransferase family protein [Pseudomonas baltica]